MLVCVISLLSRKFLIPYTPTKRVYLSWFLIPDTKLPGLYFIPYLHLPHPQNSAVKILLYVSINNITIFLTTIQYQVHSVFWLPTNCISEKMYAMLICLYVKFQRHSHMDPRCWPFNVRRCFLIIQIWYVSKCWHCLVYESVKITISQKQWFTCES